jgi:hypothetical protein
VPGFEGAGIYAEYAREFGDGGDIDFDAQAFYVEPFYILVAALAAEAPRTASLTSLAMPTPMTTSAGTRYPGKSGPYG